MISLHPTISKTIACQPADGIQLQTIPNPRSFESIRTSVKVS